MGQKPERRGNGIFTDTPNIEMDVDPDPTVQL